MWATLHKYFSSIYIHIKFKKKKVEHNRNLSYSIIKQCQVLWCFEKLLWIFHDSGKDSKVCFQ